MDLLSGLDAAQHAAVTEDQNPLCIVAPAGSGKTRVLTRRIAWRADRGDLDIRRVLAITFTTRAARELQIRLAALLGRDTGTAGTFHAIARRMLADHSNPTIIEDRQRFVDRLDVGTRSMSTRALLTEIDWAQARGISPGDYPDRARAQRRDHGVDPDLVAAAYDAYRLAKRRRGVVDFDDLLATATDLIADDRAFARAQRWRFRHFFVDEYQDVNPLQQRFLTALLGDRTDLCVVGDPNQAIYAFNGADAGYLARFSDHFPGARVVELSRNHRSAPGVQRVARAILAGPTRAGVSWSSEAPTVTAYPDETAEAIGIARRLRDGHPPGVSWRHQAVLVRTHAQARIVGAILERARIPMRDQDDPVDRDAVAVLSFHSAKGLEWPVVHLAGLEEGLTPDFHATTGDAVAEERRLLYVAASRANRHLHLSWARKRRMGDRVVERSPSRWLADVEREIADLGCTAPPPRRARVRSIGPTPGADERPGDARTRLQHWRATKARAAAVPVSVILSDDVLDDLARLSPRTAQDLEAVPGLGRIKRGRFGDELLGILDTGSIP